VPALPDGKTFSKAHTLVTGMLETGSMEKHDPNFSKNLCLITNRSFGVNREIRFPFREIRDYFCSLIPV
jgi:hypothetical protein